MLSEIKEDKSRMSGKAAKNRPGMQANKYWQKNKHMLTIHQGNYIKMALQTWCSLEFTLILLT
jgi:hypothetical protein